MKIAVLALVPFLLPLSTQAREGSEASDLASGYANAFQCSGKSYVSVIYSNSGQPETIKDVKEMKPFGGVLLVRTINGEQQILDASRVVKIIVN